MVSPRARQQGEVADAMAVTAASMDLVRDGRAGDGRRRRCGKGRSASSTTARGVGQGAGDVRGAAPEQLHGEHDGVGSLGSDGKQHDGVGAAEGSGACRLNRSEYLGKKATAEVYIRKGL